ncbi:1323_t:CDS:2 [Paraglomus brasilianum]|uniref:1323_t:CDS:1 n=1 Tax=Paraglomus brasilianum TaxID=144538 RepID=A0A9N8W6A4_9GLOM|nr:1323_t:CDS:2 [Paraglomus brasilianum]
MLSTRFLTRPTVSTFAVLRRGSACFHSSSVLQTGKVFEAQEETFGSLVEKASEPVIVDFYAEWCGPCKVLAPIIESAVNSNKKVTLVKVDVDKIPDIAHKYGVSSMPTVKAFHKGKVVGGFIGAQHAKFVKEFVERAGSLAN